MYAWPSTNPELWPFKAFLPHVCPDVGVSHKFDAATAAIGEDCLALVAARPVIAEGCLLVAATAHAAAARARPATTTSALRRDVGFATSGACASERVSRASSLDELGSGRALARLQEWA